MTNRAIKYRAYPTTEQSIKFAKTFGCCRKVYNLMLSDKIESYKSTGKFTTVTPAKYKKDYPYLKEVDSLALANKQLDLQEAFRIIDFLNSNQLSTAVSRILQTISMAQSLLLMTVSNFLKLAM